MDSATATFYDAVCFHPHTAKPIRLESNTDLRERVETIIKAWHDPEAYMHRDSWGRLS